MKSVQDLVAYAKANPANLPVVLSTKFDFVINAKAAKVFGPDHSSKFARPSG